MLHKLYTRQLAGFLLGEMKGAAVDWEDNIFGKRCMRLLQQPWRVFSLLTLGGVACLQNAFALCVDGRHPGLAAETAASSAVVIGRVDKASDYTTADDPAGIAGTTYTITVLQVKKGHPPKTLHIQSENTSSRFPMSTGRRYLLLITGGPENGIIDACGNSHALDERIIAG